MSLLSSIKSVASKVVSNIPIIGKTITPQVKQTVNTAAAVPKTSSTTVNFVNTASAAITAPSTVSLAKQTAAATVITSSAAASVVAPTTTLSLIKSVIPKSTGGKVAATIAAPVVISAVASSSKLRSDIASTPQTLSNLGTDIGLTYENPTKENLTSFVKDHPIATGVTAGAALIGVGAAGKGLVGTLATLQNTSAVKENTALSVIDKGTASLPVATSDIPKTLQSSSNVSTVPAVPATTEVKEVKPVGTVTRRKYRRTRLKPVTSNRIHIDIFNQSKHLNTSKRISY